jgi:WD40 repeat protein
MFIIRLVQAEQSKQQDDADLSGIVIQSVEWNSDGSRLAVGKGRAICGEEFGDERFAIQIIDGESGQLSNSLVQPRCLARSLVWSPDDSMLISGSDDAGMWFWDTITMQFIRTESVAFEGPSTLVWRPNAQQLFGLAESAIYVYDISSQEISFDFPDRRTKQVTAIAVSPDGDSLASGDSDGVIRIIDTATRQLITSIQTGADTVTALDWNLDGTELASGYTDGTVEIWDIMSGTPLLTLVGHIDRISQIKWRPDSNTLASASYDGTVRIWNLETGFSGIITYPGKVLALDWKPDGSQLAYGGVRNDYQDTQVVIVEPPQPSIPISTLTPAP